LGATPSTYLFTINVTGFNTTTNESAGYVDFAVIRTTGAAGFLLGTQPALIVEEGTMVSASVTPTIVGNNIQFQVTGVAGSTIDWLVLATYIKVS
jgi:hypothetical protein